jgi:arylsulfatase A-like enzyme
VARLDELGVAERTVVVFTGDNGGLDLDGDPTENKPLRDGKGSTYEGGVRVPTIVHWPGVTEPGSVCREPIITVDYYPTLLEITGVAGDPKHNVKVDGVSLAPLLKDARARLGREAVYWHYPHYHSCGATPYGAIRAGDWKLIEFYEDMRVELYNLEEDIGESKNLASQMPDRAGRLRRLLQQWRGRVGAQMPENNPDHQPDHPTNRRFRSPAAPH